jgi:hypothetical protein
VPGLAQQRLEFGYSASLNFGVTHLHSSYLVFYV